MYNSYKTPPLVQKYCVVRLNPRLTNKKDVIFPRRGYFGERGERLRVLGRTPIGVAAIKEPLPKLTSSTTSSELLFSGEGKFRKSSSENLTPLKKKVYPILRKYFIGSSVIYFRLPSETIFFSGILDFCQTRLLKSNRWLF